MSTDTAAFRVGDSVRVVVTDRLHAGYEGEVIEVCPGSYKGMDFNVALARYTAWFRADDLEQIA